MKRAIVVVTLLVLSPWAWAQHCGKERWPVKTLADPQGNQVVVGKPVNETVRGMRAFSAPSKKELQAANATRIRPQEFQVFSVVGILVGYKHEADDDFHVVIADPSDASDTMIVEIPSAVCDPPYAKTFTQERAFLESNFGKATSKFRKLKTIVFVHVTGVGFFDFLHGQTGVAPNGFELHPVTSIATVKTETKPRLEGLAVQFDCRIHFRRRIRRHCGSLGHCNHPRPVQPHSGPAPFYRASGGNLCRQWNPSTGRCAQTITLAARRKADRRLLTYAILSPTSHTERRGGLGLVA